MIKTRKTKHLDYVSGRMMEIHNEIMQHFLNETTPDLELMIEKKELLMKYRRRFKLLKR